jgi:hypothetical protein
MKEIPLEQVPREPTGDEGIERPSEWAAQDDYKMLSMAFTVKSLDGQFAESLRWHLDPFLLEAPAPGGLPVELVTEAVTGEPGYLFRFATQERFHVQLLPEAIHRAVWEIQRSVPEYVRDFVLLHAGAVVRDGGALLLPAKTSSGKSSLCLGLLEGGFSYLSDDVGAIDPVTGRACPYPKLIKLIPDALEFFPGLEERLQDRTLPFPQWERFARPEDVGAEVAQATPIRWVVFPTDDFEGSPVLEPITSAKCVELLAANCFNLYRYGEGGVVLLSRIASSAEAFQLSGGSLRDRIELVRDQLHELSTGE